MRICPDRPLLTSLRRAVLRRRAWMPALLLALLLAGLGQARHLHEHDDAAKHAGADHCTFCLQVERLASAPSEIPAAAAWAAPGESPERAIAAAPRYLLAFSYDARGPPAA